MANALFQFMELVYLGCIAPFIAVMRFLTIIEQVEFWYSKKEAEEWPEND